jgi:group I intron endonuclease
MNLSITLFLIKTLIIIFSFSEYNFYDNIGTVDIIFCTFVPVMIYSNTDTEKLQILTITKQKAGIYLWTHKESNKKYIDSAVDLSKRLKNYLNKSYLNRHKSMYIYNAILHHDYSSFSLTILEYVDILNLSKKEARNLILEKEQHFLDLFLPEYNINPIAGSRLGSKHTEETKILMSKSKSEEIKAKLSEINKGENNPNFSRIGEKHPFYGQTHTSETKALISLALSGENHPNFGKTHTPETKAKMSDAKTDEKHPMFGKTHTPETKALISLTLSGENHPFYGKTHTAESLAKMSKRVFVYSNLTPTIISHEFISYSEAAKYFKCSIMSISRYIKSKELFQKQWILSISKR